jgi:hypothetical protein
VISVGLPARPKAIRTSPDGITFAVLYGEQWLSLAVDDRGAILHVTLLLAEDVEGWTEWNPVEAGGG